MDTRSQTGFTLIELMIVVLIIAVLAAIAMPAYQVYVARSQAASGLADIAGGRVSFEQRLNDAQDVSLPDQVGLAASTPRCQITVSGVALTGQGSITCTLRGSSSIAGRTIILTRNASDGQWSCASTVDEDYRPQSCQAP